VLRILVAVVMLVTAAGSLLEFVKTIALSSDHRHEVIVIHFD
jgi:hypothetical protein